MTSISCSTGKHNPGHGQSPSSTGESKVHGRVKVGEDVFATIGVGPVHTQATDSETREPKREVQPLKYRSDNSD